MRTMEAGAVVAVRARLSKVARTSAPRGKGFANSTLH